MRGASVTKAQIAYARRRAQTVLRQASALITAHTKEASLGLAQLALLQQRLADARGTRISSARRVQGAACHRDALCRALWDLVSTIRNRIKHQFRGPGHKAIRQAFGEGLVASAPKKKSVARLASTVLEGAARYPDALRRVRVTRPTLQRVRTVLEQLQCVGSQAAVLGQRRTVQNDVRRTVEEILRLLALLAACYPSLQPKRRGGAVQLAAAAELPQVSSLSAQ